MADSQITGLAEVQRRLQSLPSEIVDAVLKQALENAAAIVAAAVETRAKGELKAAVRVVTEVDVSAKSGVSLICFAQTPSERTGQPLDKVAAEVEFGHMMVTHAGKRSGHVPAHPFIRPGGDASAQQATEAFVETFADGLSALRDEI